ncbi:GTP-binding protein [Spirulina major]|uniref:GTP-binding protein n=1 Tax=Spirulina major TaxID=270636 RepID=UPI000933D433|nr:GTP-binding protein [Spirulina major]
MSSVTLIAVAGPTGSGKTTWMSQFLQDPNRSLFYCCPGAGAGSVDQVRIAYRFPWVQLIPEHQAQQVLTTLPDQARVYFEVGFHLDLDSPFFAALPCHHVAVLPPELTASEWHDWADEVIPGNAITVPTSDNLPELWRSPLTGQVFDPPSLDEMLIELTSGAYGRVQRAKGIFELPDGRAFYVDFLEGLQGIEYTELSIPRWLEGRPNRLSGIEVVGWNLDKDAIAQTVLDGCLSDSIIAQYQEQYKALISDETNPEETILA